MDDESHAESALTSALACMERGHYDDAVRAITSMRSRNFVSGHVKCINVLASIAARKKKENIDVLISELKKIKIKLNSFSEPDNGTEEVVSVLIANLRTMLEEARVNIKQTLENTSKREEDFSIISGVPLEVRARERFLMGCLPLVNRIATEFFVFGNFIGTSRIMLRVYNATAVKFISLCEEFELDKVLDRVADAISKTVHKVFLDPVPPQQQTNNQGYNRNNNLIKEINRNRKEFSSTPAAGEELIGMLSQLAEKLTKRGCWRHMWTVVSCIHKISEMFDAGQVKIAAYASNAKFFLICHRWDYHAYCLFRAAQDDPSTYGTQAVIAALCSHDDDKQYDPFEASTGLSINATISAVFDDPVTDNESLLNRLLVPRVTASVDAAALKLVNVLRNTNTPTDFGAVHRLVSEIVTAMPFLKQYEPRLRETILRRQVEEIAQQNNVVSLSQLAMNHASPLTDKEYVEVVEPVILQDNGVPVDIDCKGRTISFRNSAKKKLHSCYSKLAHMVNVRPAAPTISVNDASGGSHIAPAVSPCISLNDLQAASTRGTVLHKLQSECRETKENRKLQRLQEIEDEQERNKEMQMRQEKEKQEQHRKARLAVENAKLREKNRQQGLLNVIKLLRKKYPGLQVEDAMSTRKNSAFEDEMTQILADYKRKKEEGSKKETLQQNLLERALRRMDIPKRKAYDESNAELHRAERAAARENFLVQHRKEYEKRKKERAVLQLFAKDAETFTRDVIQRGAGERSSRRDEQQMLLEEEMRRIANIAEAGARN